MTDKDNNTRLVNGLVKWFDPTKGFGFVVAEEGGPDILLHANVLRNFGQGSVADGAKIEIYIQSTDRGAQATEVVSIDANFDGQSNMVDLEDANADDPSLPFEPARVKWFDKSKGFGFANVFGNNEDIFVHVEVLRRSGLADLQPGEAVSLRVVDGKRGRMACCVASWETASKLPE